MPGTFYPASKPKAPAVLMLHRYGGNRQGWENLSKSLQEKGFSVLIFDFGGHGGSTKVTPDFWKIANNAQHIRRGKKSGKKTLKQREFRGGYEALLGDDMS